MKLSIASLALAMLSQTVWARLSATSTLSVALPDHHTVKDIEEMNMSAETRIVGGSTVPAGKYPWFASSTGNSFCGASLIHEDILLTAAHCTSAFPVGSSVYIGAILRGSSYGGAHLRTVEAILQHEEYIDEVIQNDYMLLKLNSPVPIVPVELNTDVAFPPDEEVVTSMGFGRTSEGGSVTYLMKEVDLKMMNNDICASQYDGVLGVDGETPLVFQEEVMMCAGVVGGGKSACNGDSGGPVVTADGKQVGVVSFGVGCARADFYGVYARVTGASDWIQDGICSMSANPPYECEGSLPEKQTEAPMTEDKSENAFVRVQVAYDFYVSETTWEIAQDGGVVIYEGPQYEPAAYELWNTSFTEFPIGEYTFTIYDSACDGLVSAFGNGFFRILLIDGDDETELASGGPNFECSQSVSFVVASGNGAKNGDSCQDSSGLIVDVSDSVTEDCKWLAENVNEYDHLCDWEDVAFACPVTCGSCEDIAALTCTDKKGEVEIDVSVGSRGCEWLSQNMDRYGYACDRTEVAFHCPSTCKTGDC